MFPIVLLLASVVNAQGFPSSCASIPPYNPNATIGVCPNDFTIIGPQLEPVHQSTEAPTGLAVDENLNIYLTYPRNTGPTPNNVVIATSFTTEEPWPNAAIQNCTPGQNASECFINVQNVVLDSIGQMWTVDSGIPPGAKSAVPYGAKIQSFNITTRQLIRTYIIPESLYYNGMNANDVRINNTLTLDNENPTNCSNPKDQGYAFITDESATGSLLSISLSTGTVLRRLFNTTTTTASPSYVGSYNGSPIYSWTGPNGTTKTFITTGADGIALASGNIYWGVLASRRFYFIPQHHFINASIPESTLLSSVQFPGELASEQAGFTADDLGRVYMTASEQNAIYYVDTLQSQVNYTVNNTPPGASYPGELVRTENYVVKTLVRNALIQHADSAAIWDGWLYFCTNQLALSPGRQYGNVDGRKGPFRSYRVWIGRGPAV